MKPERERRRTIRLRRSALIRSKLEDLDRPALKCAEEVEELEQAFNIVYETYRESSYIKSSEDKMYFSHFCLLPTSNVFIFKEYLTVVSTLTGIGDTEEFGLPMDSLYKEELDVLRKQGHRLVEMSMLATPKERRMENLVVYLIKVAINYAEMTGFDHLCAMVNPKHVRFYKDVLLFDEYGEEKWYDAVNAPAVAVGTNMRTYMEKIRKVYGDEDFETNLYEFFEKVCEVKIDPTLLTPDCNRNYLRKKVLHHFLDKRPAMLESLNEKQKHELMFKSHN